MAYEDVPKQKSPKIWIIAIVMLGLSIPCCGIFAAISIPAFIQYINRSKAVEAEVEVSFIAMELERSFAEGCELPPSLPATGSVANCCGGGQCAVDPAAKEVWEAAGVRIGEGPYYFVYETEYRADSTYAVRAVADFGCDGEPNHTYEVVLEPNYGECALDILPGRTYNEFQ